MDIVTPIVHVPCQTRHWALSTLTLFPFPKLYTRLDLVAPGFHIAALLRHVWPQDCRSRRLALDTKAALSRPRMKLERGSNVPSAEPPTESEAGGVGVDGPLDFWPVEICEYPIQEARIPRRPAIMEATARSPMYKFKPTARQIHDSLVVSVRSTSGLNRPTDPWEMHTGRRRSSHGVSSPTSPETSPSTYMHCIVWLL